MGNSIIETVIIKRYNKKVSKIKISGGKTLATLAYTGDTYESGLEKFKLTSKEFSWLEECAKNHTYFRIELDIMNKIKRVYLMDASDAPDLSSMDKSTYNFERRIKDEGMKKVKLNKKEFDKFWNKYMLVGFKGMDSIEYKKGKGYEKIYRCRPIGWILDEIRE